MIHMALLSDKWFGTHMHGIKTWMRIVFGVVWGIDGALKFTPGMSDSFSGMISSAASGQPAWLGGWFAFWSSAVSTNAAFFVYLVGVLELALAFALIFGFMRKVAYAGGFLISFFIWAVPEGFGGPYGPGSTDIGTGIIYALVFLCLAVFNAAFGPSRYSIDHMIEARWPKWSAIAEIKR